MSAEENKAHARRLIEAINKNDLKVFDELVAPDYVYYAPGSPEVRGPEGFKQIVSMYRGAFPDLEMTVDGILAEADMVALRWTATGTHRGDLMGIPPTGKRVSVTGQVMSRFVGGKVVEDREVFDALGMMQQLGAIPAQASSTA